MTDRRLLLVHAHPDDETIVTGATMAKYAAEGAEVTLVTCTRGEEGEIIPPELAHLGSDREDTLGEYRIGELDKACLALGVRDHRFLGGPGRYRDSGMMGAATNDRPGCFWQADVEEAAHLLAAVIREVRPHVVVTYDDNGGYGHPDHIQAHRVTVRAFEKAAERALPGSPWQTRKLYAIAQPQSLLEASAERLRDNPGPFRAPDSAADIAPGTPDSLVTARIDASPHWAAKALAMRAHATQISVEGELFALSNGIAQEIGAVEYFTQIGGAAPRRGNRGPDGLETDLFA
ncbi:N-acetyl-1-D-myo-inositol-2-amino-2-deoxy-alpha-D-glucopyranoside deacetylase [Streptomonospora sp. PA3]|uniref:N-acetyl-1-D-myo-inositol-2-amino-2-deoxy-alpha- D-glucopyranoside deacetylase n=1 Tax=Streptomonospora sp. PA3 TaxID=2607326 RepID=UPI0012DDF0B5|nr:N-acetyl-1-D-myo-inositol-2-amino-2-deoxy-alpha-D-glucopyranoside deacetylase [Streptomonospora sp. PA3]MUL39810.1 N-acetyl-1-D-myo-inositol-2-amino-2-deoxy-alpha-D-glucopyranoside deacetylase [Streptomonospora sp. PA3]